MRSKKRVPGGTRTRNLCLRRAAPYPLGHRDSCSGEKKGCCEVLPGLEPGLQGSEPWVLTNYTIEPSSCLPPGKNPPWHLISAVSNTRSRNANHKLIEKGRRSIGQPRSGGVVGYHVCLTRTRSRVRSSSRVLSFFANACCCAALFFASAPGCLFAVYCPAFSCSRHNIIIRVMWGKRQGFGGFVTLKKALLTLHLNRVLRRRAHISHACVPHAKIIFEPRIELGTFSVLD